MSSGDRLEENIERLLRSVEPELKLPEPYRNRTVNTLFSHGRSLASKQSSTSSRRSMLIRYWPGIAVLVVIVFFAVWFLFFNESSGEQDAGAGVGPRVEARKSDGKDDLETDEGAKSSEMPTENVEAEFKWVLDMGVAGDIDALVGVLSEGSLLAKIAAANYLGKLGDVSVIEPLERASAEWLGQDKDNPFIIAINQIEARMQAEAEPVDEVAVEETKPSVTAIEGYVYDSMGEPESDVTLNCYDARGFCVGDFESAERVASAVTDAEGFYRIEEVPEHLCFVERSDNQHVVGVVRRAVVPMAGKASRLDFGGKSLFSGWVSYNDTAVAETRLFMGEVDKPMPTVFGCYAITDAEGKYTFMGVPSGRYGVFFESGDGVDEWIKIGTVDIEEKDVADYGFGVSTADVFVSVSSEDPNYVPEIADVFLYEGSEFEGLRAGFALEPTEAGEPYVFEGVASGTYRVVVVSESGVFYSETFELPTDIAEINISLDIDQATALVDGVLEGHSGQLLIMWSSDKKVGAYVGPDSDGMYMAGPLPAGQYFLGYSELGMDRPLEQFVLEEDEQEILDVDVGGWLELRTSLWVYVVDENGVPLTGASVTVQGGSMKAKETTGLGAYFVVEPGEYTIRAQYPSGGYKQGSQKVQLTGSNVFGPATDEQIVYVILGR